ncbi:MAG: hypothetical protein H7122_02185 [Chitinophagaceae bacterium]|nr:hypothetical protein [Chitinophagaceae bacterium]
MQQLKSIGKIFFGLGIAGIGVLHFIYPGFRPVLLPIPPEATQNLHFLVYLTGAVLIVAGICIAIIQNVKTISLFLGLLLLLFVIIGHLPNRLTNNPGILGAWTDALKLLALSGGAFIISTLYPDTKNNRLISSIEKMALCGKYFFALMLIIFGIDHFLYADFVKTLVPSWIPGQLFWTYFGGIALIGSGLAVFLNFKPRAISLLLGAMLFIWLIVLHIPRAIVAPRADNGNEWTSVLQCLAFIGIAVLYPYSNNARASLSRANDDL